MAVYTTFTSKAQYYSGSIGGCVGGGEDYRTIKTTEGIYVYLAFNPQTAGLSKRCILTHIEITGNFRVTNTSNGAGLTLKGSLLVKPIQVLNPTLSGTELLNVNTCSLGEEIKLMNAVAGSTSYKSFTYSNDVTINYYVAPNDFVGGRFLLRGENVLVDCRIWLKDVQFKVTRKRACDITFVTGVDGVANQTTLYDYGAIPSYSGSLSKPNYTFKGWKAPNGTVYTGTLPAAGEVDITYTAVWERTTVYVTYDSIFSFKRWAENNLATWDFMRISNVSDAGFTGTALVEDAYTQECRPLIPVEVGKTYTFECDVSGGGFEFFVFNCNSSGGWADFTYGNTKKFDFIPSTNYVSIRCDVVGTGTVTNFSNFRIYPADCPYMSASVSATERTDLNNWSMPTPVRKGYTFKGWNTKPDGTGAAYTSGSTYPSADLVLYSQWELNKINNIKGHTSSAKKVLLNVDEVKALLLHNTKIYE